MEPHAIRQLTHCLSVILLGFLFMLYVKHADTYVLHNHNTKEEALLLGIFCMLN